MRNYAGTCKSISSYNLVYNFWIQLLSLKSSVFVVHFSNAFLHGNEAFPKVSSQNEIIPLLVINHLPYSKYRSVKMLFYTCRYQNQNFSLVSRQCRIRVARVVCVWHSCCNLDQIQNNICFSFCIEIFSKNEYKRKNLTPSVQKFLVNIKRARASS